MTPSSRTAPTFANCRIESELGRGGMGVVYRATQLPLSVKSNETVRVRI